MSDKNDKKKEKKNDEHTTTITTPFSESKVVLRQWITGREREYINEPMYDMQVQANLQSGRAKAKDIEVGDIMRKQTHREIEKFVISVDGDDEDVVDAVLGMHEKDTEFVKQKIDDLGQESQTNPGDEK